MTQRESIAEAIGFSPVMRCAKRARQAGKNSKTSRGGCRPRDRIILSEGQSSPDSRRPRASLQGSPPNGRTSVSNASPTHGVSNSADAGSHVPGRRQRQVRSVSNARL